MRVMNVAWALTLLLISAVASGQARLLLRNGTVAPAIVGGYTPPAGSRPWMVSLRDSITKKHFCGGTMVDARVVLTAAHCISNEDNGRWSASSQLKARVVVGGYPQSVQAPADYVRNVIAVRRHRKFNLGFTQDRFDNDVALLLLDKPIAPARLKTITLPNPQLSLEFFIPEWTWLRVAGWGYTDADRKHVADKLQEIEMGFLAPGTCQTYFPSMDWTNGITKKSYVVGFNWYKNNMFCMRDKAGAISSNGAFRGGTCNGDSGGPVFIDLGGGRAEQWGIVSHSPKPGGKCGRSISAYTDVAALRNWIDDGILLLTHTTFLATFDFGLSSYQGFHRRLVYTPPAYLRHFYRFTLLKTGGIKGAELLAWTALTNNGPGIGTLLLLSGSKELVQVGLNPDATAYALVQGRPVVIGPAVSLSFPNGKFRILPAYWGQTLTFTIEQATMTLTVTQPFKFGQYEPYLSLRVEIKNPIPTGLSGMLASSVPDSKQYVAPP